MSKVSSNQRPSRKDVLQSVRCESPGEGEATEEVKCTQCRKLNDNLPFKRCLVCAAKARKCNRAGYEARKKAGICNVCCKPVGKKKSTVCSACMKKQLAYYRTWRKKRHQEGICIQCGNKNDQPQSAMRCLSCTKKQSALAVKSRRKRIIERVNEKGESHVG